MTNKVQMLLLLIICSSCTTSFPIKASLYKSPWYASFSNGTPIVRKGANLEDRLSLIFTTDLPHPELEKKKKWKVTGCKSECTETQTLLVSNLPLQPGRYSVVSSDLFIFDSLSVNSVYIATGIKQIGSRFYKKATGWVYITRYEPSAGLIEGKFDITFKDSTDNKKPIHFKRGKLSFNLKKRLVN